MSLRIDLVLITTVNEIHSGRAVACLEKYITSAKAPINLTISTNREVDDKSLSDLDSCEMVNKLIMHNCNISEDEDVYNMLDKPVENPHELGESSGPNLLFYRTMEYLQGGGADYYMLIESDTRPVGEDWMSRLVDYCMVRKSRFLIGGSRYKGDVKLPPSDWREHLNGVALYKNDPGTYELLNGSRKMLKHYIHKKNYVRLNYDVALWYYLNSPDGDKYLSRVMDTNIIANYSLPDDRDIKLQTIIDKHPYTTILHQKP